MESFKTYRDVRHRRVADQLAREVKVILVLGSAPAEQKVGEQHGELGAVGFGDLGAVGRTAVDGLTPVRDVPLFGNEGLEVGPPSVDA